MPKASGTAIAVGLRETIHPDKELAFFGPDILGPFSAYDTIPQSTRDQIIRDPDEVPPGADFIHGHVSAPLLRAVDANIQLLTILREPITRLLSLWAYWRAIPVSGLVEVWGSEWAALVQLSHGPLRDFLSDERLCGQTDNIYARLILGSQRLPVGSFLSLSASASEALAEEALDALDRFAFADVAENRALADNLTNWLDRPFHYKRVNETRKPPEMLTTNFLQEIDGAALELLQQRTGVDGRIWEGLARRRDVPLEAARAGALMRSAIRYAALLG